MAECKVDDVTYTSAPLQSTREPCRGCAAEHNMRLCGKLGDCGSCLANVDNFIWVKAEAFLPGRLGGE